MEIKRLLKENYLLYRVSTYLVRKYYNLVGGVKIENKGKGHFKKDVVGKGNKIVVGKGTFIRNPIIKIRGHNNRLVIGDNCSIYKNVGFQIDGNDLSIILGNGTSIQHGSRFHAQHANITVGEDCMFSNNIFIRTSDSHPIYDAETNEIINPAKGVVIGNHVWLAANSKIFKGTIVGDGSVIGAYSLVTKKIPQNCIAAGIPARVVKENVCWSRSKR